MKTIEIVWSTEDVQEVRPDLDENQAYEVLIMANKEHDANVGINWEVLESWADYLYPEPDEEDEDDEKIFSL